MGKKRDSFVEALEKNKSREYIGCSNYMRYSLADGGIIPQSDRDNSDGLWAIKGYSKILDNEDIFEKLPASTEKIKGDILWYAYRHVSASAGGNDVYESAPCGSNHPYGDNGLQTDKFSNHSYNCSGVALTCIYRIKEVEYDEESVCAEDYDVAIPSIILKKFAKNEYVKKLQTLLNKKIDAGLDIDGSFGPLTYSAVISYQKAYNLIVDGIVGPQTWGSLLS